MEDSISPSPPRCGICYGVEESLLALDCHSHHEFCVGCWREWWYSCLASHWNFSCPMCRQVLVVSAMHALILGLPVGDVDLIDLSVPELQQVYAHAVRSGANHLVDAAAMELRTRRFVILGEDSSTTRSGERTETDAPDQVNSSQVSYDAGEEQGGDLSDNDDDDE